MGPQKFLNGVLPQFVVHRSDTRAYVLAGIHRFKEHKVGVRGSLQNYSLTSIQQMSQCINVLAIPSNIHHYLEVASQTVLRIAIKINMVKSPGVFRDLIVELSQIYALATVVNVHCGFWEVFHVKIFSQASCEVSLSDRARAFDDNYFGVVIHSMSRAIG